jgi:hypothetical protein
VEFHLLEQPLFRHLPEDVSGLAGTIKLQDHGLAGVALFDQNFISGQQAIEERRPERLLGKKIQIRDSDADPAVYYMINNCVGYSGVLERLSRVNPDALRNLLGMAHKSVNGKVAPRSPARTRR